MDPHSLSSFLINYNGFKLIGLSTFNCVAWGNPAHFKFFSVFSVLFGRREQNKALMAKRRVFTVSWLTSSVSMQLKPSLYGNPDVGLQWDNIYSVDSFSSFSHPSLRLETVSAAVRMRARADELPQQGNTGFLSWQINAEFVQRVTRGLSVTMTRDHYGEV